MDRRRDFLKHSLLAAAAVSAPARLLAKPPAKGKGGAPKKLLVLGGTKFLGPAVVEAAKQRGWTITLFNRGKTDPKRFPELETLLGDRDGKLDALKGRSWDYVIDTSGYVPRVVRDSAALLADHVSRYLFISTISVYPEKLAPGADENAPVATTPDPTVEKVSETTYGPLKALCEQAVEKALPGRAINVRPGLIVGPDDPTDRFTYWPARADRGGEILAPGEPSDPVQVIDVRDLGAWCVALCAAGEKGTYNATGPAKKMGVGEMIDACRAATAAKSTLTWADAKFLEAEKVEPWSQLTVWVPPGPDSGITQIDNRRAVAKGLTFRPIGDTARDTLAWWKGLPEERRKKPRAGLAPEREAEVLKKWHERAKKPAK